MDFRQTETLEERLAIMRRLAERFREQAERYDREGSFPYDHIERLKQSGYTALTVPRIYGGKEISLYEMVRLQEMLASGDGSTALLIGWHVGTMLGLCGNRAWKESALRNLCGEVMNGALINSAATEPATGSPTRGGTFQTKAVRDGGGWKLNGRKTFTTLAPVLDYFLVHATVEEAGRAAVFLVPRSCEGLRIEETWDSIAMRGTGSHDLVLEDVRVAGDGLVEWIDREKPQPSGWLLHIPACYLGIAQAAQTYAVRFAKSYRPNSITGSILELPHVQMKIGEIELEMMRARTYLYSVARRWDEADERERQTMKPDLAAVKYAVTNAALKVVDLAMRIVGAHSLSISNPLQRYYRDVRAGLHNPPMDDMTIQMLARTAIARESDESSAQGGGDSESNG